MKTVVDASFVVKLFVDEPDSEAARIRFLEIRAIAPDLILAEVWNAVWKRMRQGFLDNEQALAVGGAIAAPFLRLTPIRDLADNAMTLSLRLDHPVYDCLYLALAQRESCPLLSADQRMIALAGSIGLEAQTL